MRFRTLTLLCILMLSLIPITGATGTDPQRGRWVPADAGTQTHPFVEQLVFQSQFRSASVRGVGAETVTIEFTNHGEVIRRSISRSQSSVSLTQLTTGENVIVKWTGSLDNKRMLLISKDRRGQYLIVLGGSLLLCIVVGGWITIRATVGMLAGIGFFLFWSIPRIQSGSPILWEIMLFYAGVTLLILPASLGWNRKAISAVAAALTTGAVSMIVLLAGARWIGVVGLRNETLQVIEYAIRYFPDQVADISIPSIMVGSTMIGAMGVILDVCVDVTSSTAEISRARPDLSFPQLLNRTLTVSSRLVGTMTNTLLLAYIGSNLFVLLTIYSLTNPAWITLNEDFVAMEVLRGLGGALGFLGAVPLAVFFYWLWLDKEKQAETTAYPAPPD